MNSGTWFQCHIYSSLWGTLENPFPMKLSPASHGTETTFGWRRVACAMASNVGILHASVGHHFGQAETRCPETSWSIALGHKAPKTYTWDSCMSVLHSFSTNIFFPHALTHPSSQPFLELKPFPSQHYWRVMCTSNLTERGFPMRHRG